MRVLLACVLVAAGLTSSRAATLTISFAKDGAAKAEWEARWDVTERGLGWEGKAGESRDGWFLTKPVGVGLAWRPLVSTRITAVVKAPVVAETTGSTTSYDGTGKLYVRYSADAEHWSSWQELEIDSAALSKERQQVFHGSVGVPMRERAGYELLRKEYLTARPAWRADEEAATRWIAQKDPKFFERERPFIGYVQFLYETPMPSGQRLVGFSAEIEEETEFMHEPAPKELKGKEKEKPWRFTGKVSNP